MLAMDSRLRGKGSAMHVIPANASIHLRILQKQCDMEYFAFRNGSLCEAFFIAQLWQRD